MSRARRLRVAEAIRSIKAFHAMGRRLRMDRERHMVASRYGGTAEAAGDSTRLEMEFKARQFADEFNGYSRAQLAELCRLIKTVQPEQGDALGIVGRTHVIRLLSVKWPRRAKLQKLAVEHGWSLRRLNREIAADLGTRRQGGRYRRLPADRAGLLAVLECECERWRRLQTALHRRAEGVRKPASTAGLPTDLAQRIVVASNAVRDVQATIDKALKKLHPNRVQRLAPEKQEDNPTQQGDGRKLDHKIRPKSR